MDTKPQTNPVKIDVSGVEANEEAIIKALSEAIDQIKHSKGKLKSKSGAHGNEFEKITLGNSIDFTHRS